MKYQAKVGGPLTDEQATIVGDFVRLQEETAEHDVDMASARTVVHAARTKSSPLHPLFEWDDRKAADAQRIAWARKLIANVVVIPVGLSKPSRAFHSVPVCTSDDEVRYVYKSSEKLTSEQSEIVAARYRSMIVGMINELDSLGVCKRSKFWSAARKLFGPKKKKTAG